MHVHGQAAGAEAAETLPGGAGTIEGDRIVWQPVGAVALRNFAAQYRADGAVDIAQRDIVLDRCAVFQGRRCQVQQGEVQGAVEAVVLGLCAVCADLGTDVRFVQNF